MRLDHVTVARLGVRSAWSNTSAWCAWACARCEAERRRERERRADPWHRRQDQARATVRTLVRVLGDVVVRDLAPKPINRAERRRRMFARAA